jgi:hypothetical protein
MTSLGFTVTLSSRSQLMYELALLLSKPVELISDAHKYLICFTNTLSCYFEYPHSETCKAITDTHKIAYAYYDEIWIAWERVVGALQAMYIVSVCSKGGWQGQIAAAVKHAVVIYVEELVVITTRTIVEAKKKSEIFYKIVPLSVNTNFHLGRALLENANMNKSCRECYITEEKKTELSLFIIWANNEVDRSNAYQQAFSLSGYSPIRNAIDWHFKLVTIERKKEGIDKQLAKYANTQTQEKKL